MANPIVIPLTKETWVKVASSVFTGQISILDTSAQQILTTYRVPNDPPPTSIIDGVAMSRKSIKIISNEPIDVYLYAQIEDSVVRVDL